MKIDSAQLQIASTHGSLLHAETRESLKMWVSQGQTSPRENPMPALPATVTVSLSEAGMQNATADSINKELKAAVDNNPQLSLLRRMLEFLTGRQFQVFDASQLQGQTSSPTPAANTPAAGQETPTPTAPATAGYGLEYDSHQSYTEIEQTSFSASGTVKTADGRSIDFSLQLSMTRSYHEESDLNLRLGDAAKKTDPLVLNFSGTAAQLTDQRFAFDLNSDGTATEQVNSLSPGSGYLVFDRNHDGVVNNGSELFGPASGNGYGELSQLDSDKNGWIDENDAAFSQLQIWQGNQAGKSQLQSLGTAGVGAISLSRIGTPFDIKNHANQLIGQVRDTGIFLHEDGSTGTIQQIDLTA
jgi:hypothetical protein